MIAALRRMDLLSVLTMLIAVILSMSVHEMAHALVSYAFGDQTARSQGRLSLNPFRHIDWMGTLCLLLFGFGWAKPVPIDPRYYKNEKTGIIWTAFAGPASNLIMSFLFVFFYYFLYKVTAGKIIMSDAGAFFMNLCATVAVVSAGFGIFNLIPVPPLDGARIFWSFLPEDQYMKLMAQSRWLSLVLMVLIISGLLNPALVALRSTMIDWFSQASVWILSLF